MLAIQENRPAATDAAHKADAQARSDMAVADFLCSRLCHDLVGPISAVGNGLELLAENPQLEEEAVALARRSASRAAALLQFYRLAFGNAGNQLVRATEAHSAAQGVFLDGRTRLEWPSAEGVALPPGGAKLLLNMLMVAAEALPRGGKVAVVLRTDADGIAVDVAALGADAKLPEDVVVALTAVNPPADLNPRTVQAYYLGRLAAGFGQRLEPQAAGPGDLRLRLRLPPA